MLYARQQMQNIFKTQTITVQWLLKHIQNGDNYKLRVV